MKRVLIILIGLCIALFACNNGEPKIQVDTVISPLSTKEFNGLGGTDEYGVSTQKDFKKLTFNFTMEHDEGVDRKIRMFDDWKGLLNNHDEYKRYWTGTSTSDDIIGKNTAEYHYELFFYSKGLSENDIKGIFNEAFLRVELSNKEGTQSKSYKIVDSFKFKN